MTIVRAHLKMIIPSNNCVLRKGQASQEPSLRDFKLLIKSLASMSKTTLTIISEFRKIYLNLL